MSRPIWLDINDDSTSHGNVTLTLGNTARCEDSYYLEIDQQLDPGTQTRSRAASVLAGLLGHWLVRLNQPGTVDLPAGFSDECMTWLRCEPSDDHVTITCGWSEDSGWSISPAEPADAAPSQFVPMDDMDEVTLYRPRLLSLIRSNIGHLREIGSAEA